MLLRTPSAWSVSGFTIRRLFPRLVFVMNFGVFPSAVLVGQPAGPTRTIAIAAYQQAFEHNDMSMASSIAVVMGACQLVGLAVVLVLRSRMRATGVATLGAGKR